MNFFPNTLNNDIQVLWQPVPINQYQNQTIEHLRRQNQMLKSQLESFLQTQQSQQNQNHFVRSGNTTDRRCFVSPNNINNSSRNKQNAYFSPKVLMNHQRIFSEYSPHQRLVKSPSSFAVTHRPQQSMFLNSPQRVKRMVIEKGSDGKYFRNKIQQNKNSQFLSTCTSNNTQSKYFNNNLSTQESTFKSPMKASQHYARFSDIDKFIEKPNVKRYKSPSFFKKKPQSSNTPLFDATNLSNRAQNSHSRWNTSVTNKQPQRQFTEEIEQDQNISMIEKPKQAQKSGHVRNQAKLPTIDLSADSDSDLSIERVVKQIARKPPVKKEKSEKRDTLIFMMQEKLQNLYGTQ